MSIEKAKKLAEYEVGWWKAHHRKDFKAAMENMTNEYVLQFGVPYEIAAEAVELRIEAGKMHDKAEELEDSRKTKEAEKYWNKATELLQKHFEVLLGV